MWICFPWTPPHLHVLLPLLFHRKPDPSAGQTTAEQTQQGRNLLKLRVEANSLFVIVMVLMVPISVKLIERSRRNNQIREITGPLRHHLAPLKKKMHRGCVAGKAGVPLPALAPSHCTASQKSLHWCPRDEAAHGPGDRGDSQSRGESALTSGRCDSISTTRSHWSTSQQLLHPARAGSQFTVQTALFWAAVLFLCPLRVHCVCSSSETNGLWQPDRPHDVLALLSLH